MKLLEPMNTPLVSIGIVALNEEACLPDMLSCIESQDYPHDRIEVVLIDSNSSDSTPAIMRDFATKPRSTSSFHAVRLRNNPGKILPKGCNIFLAEATGDVIVRVDAHARIPINFISQIVAVLNEGEAVAGGPRPTITPEDSTSWQCVLHAAEESLFGASIAKYRSGTKTDSDDTTAAPQYVSSVFHPGYRRCVIEDVGYFNEDLTRTEDNDYSYRIRKAGYKIRFDPRIQSEQLIRPSLTTMAKQKYSNGYWIGRTLYIQPGCIEIYHLVPAAFVATLATGAVLKLGGVKWPLRSLIGSYALADILLSIIASTGIKPATLKAAALPAIFPILHIGYGIGTWKGLFSRLGKGIK